MSEVVYRIVEHDGGWAYSSGGSFSETFRSHDEALHAAQRAAAGQRVGDASHAIEYETPDGKWHAELSDGGDRPRTRVED